MTQKIIVTGSAGYIGGQTAIMLHDLGYYVIGIDLDPLPKHLQHAHTEFYQGDFADDQALGLIDENKPVAIIHCAGTSLVGPSIQCPQVYYDNNFVKTKQMLDYMIERELQNTRVIFSSSAATYGDPVMVPCVEEDPTLPISPYGQSKLMIEWMLQAYHRAYGTNYVAFRYFNACGADEHARHGQAPGATHIIARVLEGLRDKNRFFLFGTNYPTNDGTCIRDYIHVADLADAHIKAISYTVPIGIYNLGTLTGASNREIIKIAEQVTGLTVDVVETDPREGDPAVLTASAEKFNRIAQWQPKYNLVDIVKHAWAWYVR